MSRFDRLVLGVIVLLAGTAAVLVLIGDRVGMRVQQVTPRAGLDQVATLVRPRVVFDQQIVPPSRTENDAVSISPPVPLQLVWSSTALTIIPQQPLAREQTYSVRVAAGLRGADGRALLRPWQWQFTTGGLRAVYVADDSDGNEQLFVAPLTGDPQQITARTSGIWDFHVAADGTAITYSAPRDSRGNDLYIVDPRGNDDRKLLDCGSDDCFGPRWSPNGRQIAYARRTLPGPPRIFVLDLVTGTNAPLMEDRAFVGFDPRWSSDGQWLAWVAPLENGIRVVDLATLESAFLPSRTGAPPVWSPDGDRMLFSDIDVDDPQYRRFLLTFDVDTLSLSRPAFAPAPVSPLPTSVTPSRPADAPAPTPEMVTAHWSPDGTRVAVLQRAENGGSAAQVSIVDGAGERIAVTNDQRADHGAPRWSADGRYVVFDRVPLVGAFASAEVVMWDTKVRQVVGQPRRGRDPVWLP